MGYGSRDYYRPKGFGGFSFFPPVLKKLLIINAVVFLLQELILNRLEIGGIPGRILITKYFALNSIYGNSYFMIWQLITYQFLHADFAHIFFNMLILWMFGMEIENMWGPRKFLFFYLISGIGAGLFQIFLGPVFSGQIGPTIGASGAVYGIMIAFAMYFPDRYIFLYFLVPVKAKYMIAFLVLVEFMSIGDLSLIARLAHIGGAITGFLFILLDKNYNFNFDKWSFFSGAKFKKFDTSSFRKPFKNPFNSSNAEDANYFDINSKSEKSETKISQDEIDRILDKISKSGYQNLSEEEKRILFEASKRN